MWWLVAAAWIVLAAAAVVLLAWEFSPWFKDSPTDDEDEWGSSIEENLRPHGHVHVLDDYRRGR